MHYLMQFFTYDHLAPQLQKVSKPFADQARFIEQTMPDNPEKTMCLRKLLEAKDCAVRAYLFVEPKANS
jgi:ferritin-like protein